MNRNQRADEPTWFSTGFFPAVFFVFETDLRHLRSFFDTLNTSIENEREQFEEELAEYVEENELDDEAASAFYEGHSDEHRQLSSFFPTTLRLSSMLSACSQFETRLTDICKDLENNQKVPVSREWNSLSDSGIRKAKEFLETNFDIHISDHQTWSRLIAYYRIRNCIAHANGDISLMRAPDPTDPADTTSDDQKKTRDAVRQLKSLGISESRFHKLEVEDQFLDEMISDMQEFCSDLRDALRENAIVGPVFWPST